MKAAKRRRNTGMAIIDVLNESFAANGGSLLSQMPFVNRREAERDERGRRLRLQGHESEPEVSHTGTRQKHPTQRELAEVTLRLRPGVRLIVDLDST